MTGSGGLHTELLSEERRSEVLDTLRDRSQAEPFVWWDRLQWQTRPATAHAKLARGNDFVADLLALARSGGPDSAPVEIPELPVELRRLLAQHTDGAPAGAEDGDLLDRAARLAVDTVLEVAS
jgi:hypothetical protein